MGDAIPGSIRIPPYRDHHPSLPSQYYQQDPMPPLRRSSRRSDASGSQFDPGDATDEEREEGGGREDEDADAEGSPDEEEHQEITTRSGRRTVHRPYVESPVTSDEEDHALQPKRKGRPAANLFDDDDDIHPVRRKTRGTSRQKNLEGFVASEDGSSPDPEGGYGLRPRKRVTRDRQIPPDGNVYERKVQTTGKDRSARYARRQKEQLRDQDYQDDGGDEDEDLDMTGIHEEAADLDIEMNDRPPRNRRPARRRPAGSDDDVEILDDGGKPYSFRQRKTVNYAIPPPLDAAAMDAQTVPGGSKKRGGAKKGPGWSASGAELAKWLGPTPGVPEDDDSDNDLPGRKGMPGGPGSMLAGAGGAGLMGAGGVDNPGGVKNLGRIDGGGSDSDPLGVDIRQVSFDRVGGLDGHIQSLKELTLLPLLYPDLFQQFGVTPPRGVLFHGPPGTGKTLVARALAASCSNPETGQRVAFFMRKGADALSKWVGEAERQLRMLFEEARRCQPSIIFFDEIDGLAPVRSSKQDQVHASIVSTLLALMDGMDGRGQVVVIGATNRPDSIDPALRRPGRFDREFYFGLPDINGRKEILGIHLKGWAGWDANVRLDSASGTVPPVQQQRPSSTLGTTTTTEETPVLPEESDEVKEERKKLVDGRLMALAEMTKGFGGADLRALCTEAALHAIQRRYPQIYKSTDRLKLDVGSIKVGMRDFMGILPKLIPASARSSTSAAAPLPEQFVPVLGDVVKSVEEVVNRALPVDKRLTALEEAEFEDAVDEGEEGGLKRELKGRSLQALRIHRPRVLVHAANKGMGQKYVGAAALHHLEGYQIQSLELGGLVGDSTRTIEATIVDRFMEAKRHLPSIVYIPSLLSWCQSVPEAARSTVGSMLDTLSPSDPVLLLATVDGQWKNLPKDVKAWFGPSKDTRVFIPTPTPSSIRIFFDPLLNDIRSPPTSFPDGVKRKKRVLEELEVAPRLEPRKASEAELRAEEEADVKVLTLLKWRLGPVITELKRKWRRFCKSASEEYGVEFPEGADKMVDPRSLEPAPIPIPGLSQPELDGQQQQLQLAPIPEEGTWDQNAVVTHHDTTTVTVVEDTQTTGPDGSIVQHHIEEQTTTLSVPPAPLPHADVFNNGHDFSHVNGMANGVVGPATLPSTPRPTSTLAPVPPDTTATPAERPSKPQLVLYNMDLERMHRDLYRGDYLTPQQFLNSVGLMVANAAVRAGDDEDRFFKAQSMYTATQVSMQEFDPTFVGECDRMRAREERRREAKRLEKEARKKEKEEKEKEASENGAGGTRRSARTHGEQPELTMTDPARLERKLKRQRTAGSATPLTDFDSVAGGEESRDAKRARMMREDDPSIQLQQQDSGSQMDVDHHSEFSYQPQTQPLDPSGTGFMSIDGTVAGPSRLPILQPQPSPSKFGDLLNPASPTNHFWHPDQPPPHEHQQSSEDPFNSQAVQPMVIERTPTPHPPFVVPEDDLSSWHTLLLRDAESLSIEQMEQLRASCLNCVWRHRQEWDRAELVGELKVLLRNFVDEVRANDDEDDDE